MGIFQLIMKMIIHCVPILFSVINYQQSKPNRNRVFGGYKKDSKYSMFYYVYFICKIACVGVFLFEADAPW